MADKRALKILFDKYWSPSSGWIKAEVDPTDFQYAKHAGVMFDDIKIDHDSIVTKCIDAIKHIEKEAVVKAFVSSLSTHSLDLRSALGSYASGRLLNKHKFKSSEENYSSPGSCVVCSQFKGPEKADLNVLNFERFKFGGVRHSQPIYIWFDITQLSEQEIPEPTEQDILILKSLLERVSDLQSGKLSDAPESIKGLLKSNKNERNGIIEILGYCGILNVPDYQELNKKYTPVYLRRHSSYSRSDWSFPADIWLPEYGVNSDNIKFWFSKYIS
ncbi:MAG: hypothetical protein ABFS32_22985 [Bacteroidota bacterium]